jgi:hypothetical protein
MSTHKSLFFHFAEAYERYRTERLLDREPKHSQERLTRLQRLVQHMIPNVGALILVLVLLWAQSVGALPLGRPQAGPDAASTGTIAYQGRLADAAGAPLTGTYNMIFRLYTTATGGTPLWTEQWTGSNGVRVSDGLFNVMLGSLTTLPQSVIAGRSQLFLGITVGTDDEMQPRVQLGNVPFAVQALTVPDGSVTTAKIADGAITRAKLANDISNLKIQSGRAGADANANPDWNLTQGIGLRSYTVRVNFAEPFQSSPTVLVNLSTLDVVNTRNTRVNVRAANITPQGFDLVIETWADTVLYGAYANWLAYTIQ